MKMNMTVPTKVSVARQALSRMRRFCEKTANSTFVSEIVVSSKSVTASALSCDGLSAVRLHTCGGERIKLLAPKKPAVADAPTAYILDKPHTIYRTFIVDNINAAISQLVHVGIMLLVGMRRGESRPGVYLAFFCDPEGNALRLV